MLLTIRDFKSTLKNIKTERKDQMLNTKLYNAYIIYAGAIIKRYDLVANKSLG